MKKSLITITALSVILSTGGGSIIYGATTEQDAKKAVAGYLPAGSTFIRTELDDGKLELLYQHDQNQEWYEFKVNETTGKLYSFESERMNKRGGTVVSISEADAKKRVTDEMKGAEILSVILDRDDDLEYEVRFRTDTYYGEYTVHPESGVVLVREIKWDTWQEGKAADQTIGREKAIELAKKQAGEGTVTDVDLDWERGSYCYEVELYRDGVEYTVYLDATTGQVLYTDTKGQEYRTQESAAAGTDIGTEKARQIALLKTSGGTVVKCEIDYEHGRRVYEVEVRKDRWEYELTIDAAAGTVLEFEQEYDD